MKLKAIRTHIAEHLCDNCVSTKQFGTLVIQLQIDIVKRFIAWIIAF